MARRIDGVSDVWEQQFFLLQWTENKVNLFLVQRRNCRIGNRVKFSDSKFQQQCNALLPNPKKTPANAGSANNKQEPILRNQVEAWVSENQKQSSICGKLFIDMCRH